MKKLLIFIFVTLCFSSVYAKKVKFSVDMTGYELTSAGIHVAGDFQKYLGLPKDWLYDATKLTQEKADTNLYSIVVDLPAFKKYEYKFVNGDQDYQIEFVPVASRVGYGFITNRWIYVDSLANDTTFVGAIRFEGNAPKGLNLLRFKVDMKDAPSIAKEGVHVAGNFQAWNPKNTILYSFGNKVYEIISYVKSGAYEFKYINGNTLAANENVPVNCALNGSRFVTVGTDDAIELVSVCFSDCFNCKTPSSNEDLYTKTNLNIAPNPIGTGFYLKDILPNTELNITDINGRSVFSNTINENTYFVDGQYFGSGIYFISLKNKETKSSQFGKFIK